MIESTRPVALNGVAEVSIRSFETIWFVATLWTDAPSTPECLRNFDLIRT